MRLGGPRALIARCPQCQTRYRIAREKIGPQGARIRCSGCQTIFRVQAPPDEATPVSPAAVPVPPPPLACALIAERDPEVAKQIFEFLAARRISADVVDSGAQALLRIYRNRPHLSVLGARLPGVGAPVIVELLRRTAELRELPTIRIASSGEPAAAPEFEASATLEPGDVPGGLGPILDRLGIGRAPEAPRPAAPAAPAPIPAAARVVPPAPVAPIAPAPKPAAPRAAGAADPEVAKAERLARITVSDIILYNERKFATAAASGKIAEVLANELAEARQHFDSRIPEAVRGSRDFLVEELQRRAAQQKG